MYNDNNFSDLENSIDLMQVVNFRKQEVKFEKAYITMVCNPEFSNNEVRLWLYLQLNDSQTNGGAFPSTKKITKDTGMSASTIARTIKILEDKNAILSIQRFRKEDRKQLQNLVFLNRFNEEKGIFEDGEAWQYFKSKYSTRMAYVFTQVNKIDNKTYYITEPINEEDIIVNAKGVKVLKVSK